MIRAQSTSKLLVTYFALLVLLGVAMMIPKWHLAEWSIAATFSVALLKTVLIATVFMEIRRGSRLYLLAFCAGAFWLFILVFIGGLDLSARAWAAYF